MRLLVAAADILKSASAPAAEIAVAVAALCEAVSQQVAVPAGTPDLLWTTLKAHPEAMWASLVAGAIGRVAPASLVNDILVTVMEPSVGKGLRAEALNALCEDHAAARVSDHALVELAQVAERAGVAQLVSPVIQAASHSRSIPSEVIDRVVERWLESADPRARIAVVEALGVRGSASPEVSRRLLHDPQPTVRNVTANVLGELLGRDEARAVLTAALEVESNPKVRGVLREELEQLAAYKAF